MAETCVRCRANDHLLKAVIAVLTVRHPEFLKQVTDMFTVADAHGSPVSDMRAEVWAEVRRELALVDQLVHDDEAPAPLALPDRAH